MKRVYFKNSLNHENDWLGQIVYKTKYFIFSYRIDIAAYAKFFKELCDNNCNLPNFFKDIFIKSTDNQTFNDTDNINILI